MAGDWINPCGGARWRSLDDGAIEVEGKGVVMPPPGSGPYSLRTYVANSWRNFEPEIRKAAAKHGVPVNWILAIIATETGILSSSRARQLGFRNFCCGGPMAVMFAPYKNYKTYGGYDSPDSLFQAESSIDVGTAIMASHMKKGLDLPQISARYNSGGLCCRDSPATPSKPGGRQQNEYNLCSAKIAGVSYPEVSTMLNNVAVRELGIGPSPGLVKAGVGGGWLKPALIGAAVVAGVGAVLMLTGVVKPRELAELVSG